MPKLEDEFSWALTSLGVEHLRDVKGLPGTPDFLLPDAQLVVFVDGDFWHGWRYEEWKARLSLAWQHKIVRTIRSDLENTRSLEAMGYLVLRFWEHELKYDLGWCACRVRLAARRRLTNPNPIEGDPGT